MKKMLFTLLLAGGTVMGHTQAQTTGNPVNEDESSLRDAPNEVQHIGSQTRHMVKMFPNPTAGSITIEGFVVNHSFSYTICDVTGRMVLNGKLTPEMHRANASKLTVRY